MSTKLHDRQVESRDVLDQITVGTQPTELDNLNRSINSELTPPLRMRQDTGSNRALKIDSYTVTNPESGKNRSIQPINGLLPTITFPITITAPASSGGSFGITNTSFSGSTPTLTVSVSNYIKVGVALDANGNITLTFGVEGASIAAATAPAVPDGLVGIGFYVLQNVAGTISNVVNANIYQYGSSGGAGGGSGTASAILETVKNDFTNSPYNLVTPVIAKDDQLTLVTLGGTASYSIVDRAYKFAAISDSVTSVNMLDSLEFVDDFKDLWDARVQLFWKSDSIDTAATLQVSRDGGTHYYTPTLTRVGDNTEAYNADYKWIREEEDAVTVSNATGTTDTALNASAQASLSAKFSFTANTRLTTVTAKLKKLGTVLGSYRFAIYADSTGIVGGSGVPTTRLFSSNYALTSTLSTSATNVTWDLDGQGIIAYLTANTAYHLVIETDSTYQAGFSSGVTEIYWTRGNAAGTDLAFSYNGSTWSAIATSTFVSAETGGQESFVLVNEYDVANATNQVVLNATTEVRLSQAFTIASQQVFKRVKLYLNQLGTPVGNFTVQIIKDSAGSPSTSYSDIYAISSSYAANQNGGTGTFTFTASLPTTVLPAGTYHLVLVPDATYATNTFGSNAIRWQTDDTSPPVAGKRFDGTSWSALATPSNFTYRLEGRPMDLRFRVTAGTANSLLEGAAMYYDKEVVGVSGGTKKVQTFRFMAVAQNLNTFALTAFLPDPDLLKCYHAETGQVYTYPAFDMQGYSIVFPANTFNNGGSTETTVTLRFEQTEGYAFDNAEKNANLLAANKLGSLDASIDRSQSGRGIILRNAAGVLIEIGLDANNNFTLSTLP
jgi:hypothetical protein